MDELGFNKIAAAVLATALGYMGIKELAHAVIHVEAPAKPAYALEIPEAAGPVEEIELPFPQPTWIAEMDAERGAKVFKKCTSCHNAEEGGNNGTGPNLWNVVGAPAGQHAGFGYSSAMKSSGVVWNFEELDSYLERPSKYISGTAMNFVGLKKEKDRAAVIEYLRVASSNPVARPEPAAAPEMDTEEVTVPQDDTLIVDAPPNPLDDAPMEEVQPETAETSEE